MKKSILLSITAISFIGCGGGGGGAHNKSALDAYRASKGKVAVVSLTVNDYSKVLSGGNVSGSDVHQLINSKLEEMVSITEKQLGSKFDVKAVSEFAAEEAYRTAASGQPFEVFTPKYGEQAMPIFAADRNELIKSSMTADRAKQLCSSLGVDMIAVVYSEWETKTGGIVPTTKAVAKTVIGVYDKSGEQLYGDRHNVVGSRNVGAFSATAINDTTISAWVDAYQQGLQALVDKM